MGLVSGYGSDSDYSDSETRNDIAGPSGSTPSSNARPTAAASRSTGLSSLLPPPKSGAPDGSASAAQKRKPRQIKVGITASDEKEDDEDVAPASAPKKAKTDAAPTSSHSLFGMLPAPSKAPPAPSASKGRSGVGQGGVAARQDDDDDDDDAAPEAKLSIREASETTGAGTKAKKGNADFRAMLGLKPTATEKEPKKALQRKAEVTSIPARSNETSPQPPSAPLQEAPAASLPPPPPPPAPTDFFSIGADTRPQQTKGVSSISTGVSAAPSIEDDDPYPGWHQNPDGSWVPVTPAAQEAFEKHQASQQQGHAEHAKMVERLRAQDGIDVDSLQHVDLEAARAEWEKKPVEARMSSSSSAALDAKYAQAAGMVAAGGDEGDQKDPRDKKTNYRARQKGQLTSLFAQAEERKDELEAKWAQGKQNKRAAASRYGF